MDKIRPIYWKLLIAIGIIYVIFGVSGISFAMSCDMGSHNDSGQTCAQDAEKGSKAIDVGNKICPVSGETIKESEKATYKYKGKIYNFCCPMCIDEFKKNPKEYSAKAEQSASSEHSMQESDYESSSGSHAGHHH